VVGALGEQQVRPVRTVAEEHQHGAGPGVGVFGGRNAVMSAPVMDRAPSRIGTSHAGMSVTDDSPPRGTPNP